MSEKLEEMARHDRFMLRIQTIHLINQLREHIDAPDQDRMFAKHLIKLGEDPVPNIRFNVSKTLGALYPHFADSSKA